MKIRHPFLIKLLIRAASGLIRVWMRTVRYREHALGEAAWPNLPARPRRYIYAFWHESILLPAYYYGRPDLYVLTSRHADGELISGICHSLGFSTVRGSSTRGGVEAVRKMLREGRQADLAVTPDGPRGPRRRVQPGLIYLASRTGLPILIGGLGYQNAWRMKSWDRFALPKPFSVATCVTAAPITIPPDLDDDQFEHYRLLIERTLDETTDLAQRWAAQGARSPFPAPVAGSDRAAA